jgi:hypothetical protein
MDPGPRTWIRERLMSPAERRAARSERAVLEQLRLERDNRHTPWRRAAALDAEVRRWSCLGRL